MIEIDTDPLQGGSQRKYRKLSAIMVDGDYWGLQHRYGVSTTNQ